MWIIPKNLPIYHSAQDMKALGVDCEEFSRMSERSLMWRSKPSQSRTWSQRWKRVTYIQRLSTRILKPSHSKNFLEKYFSYRRVFLASRSQLQAEELPQKIRDTFTPTSQEESHNADQLMLFSKMSRGLSQAKQPMESRYLNMSSETWKEEVIRLRGEYSQRKKLALHTSGRESLSWPTSRTSDAEGGRIETEMTDTGFRSKRKTSDQYFGAKLRDAVEMYEDKKGEGLLKTTIVIEDGLQDQDKSSTSGKSQESWGTPRQSMANSPTEKQIEMGAPKKKIEDMVAIKNTGKLNPNWVEQLMGLPVGWTQLPIEWID